MAVAVPRALPYVPCAGLQGRHMPAMIKALSKIFRSDKAVKPLPSVPEGERYYVVGDIHGRCDLFEALVQAIEQDEKDCEGESTIILLGDLVDRGPDSAGVIAIARALVNSPRLVLADEPTGALDHSTAESLGDLLVELNRDDQVTLIVVTHSAELAAKMGAIRQLLDGRFVADTL